MCLGLSQEFEVVQLYRTTEPSLATGETRCAGCLCTSLGWFKCFEPSRTFSNLLEPLHCRVCRVLSQVFGVVQQYQTFSSYSFTGETRCAGCLCTSLGFKCFEPSRTFSNHFIAEITRCVEFFHKSLEWFNSTKPFLATALQRKQGVQGAYALVWGGSSASNLLEPSRTTSLQS